MTVRATDKGTPPLEAICTFNVTIEDINDNLPMFDKSSYEESVPRDLEVNRTVMRIAATDIDFGPNATISYSLTAVNPADADYFAIDSNTGIIQLKKRITVSVFFNLKIDTGIEINPHNLIRSKMKTTDSGCKQLPWTTVRIRKAVRIGVRSTW